MNLLNRITQIAGDNLYSTIQTLQQIGSGNLVNQNITSVNQVAEYFVPILTESQFYEKGVLTPEEFIASGNYLIEISKAKGQKEWKWCSGESGYCKRYMPSHQQYLMLSGATYFNNTTSSLTSAWIENGQIMDSEIITNKMETIRYINRIKHGETNIIEVQEPDDEDISERRYDIFITYDKFYRTPRMWIKGYDAKGFELSPEMILDNVSPEHSNKTITIEYHPHLSKQLCVSIHPCHHSTSLKKVVEMYRYSGKTILVEHSLFLFLQLISVVMPNINYFSV